MVCGHKDGALPQDETAPLQTSTAGTGNYHKRDDQLWGVKSLMLTFLTFNVLRNQKQRSG